MGFESNLTGRIKIAKTSIFIAYTIILYGEYRGIVWCKMVLYGTDEDTSSHSRQGIVACFDKGGTLRVE